MELIETFEKHCWRILFATVAISSILAYLVFLSITGERGVVLALVIFVLGFFVLPSFVRYFVYRKYLPVAATILCSREVEKYVCGGYEFGADTLKYYETDITYLENGEPFSSTVNTRIELTDRFDIFYNTHNPTEVTLKKVISVFDICVGLCFILIFLCFLVCR
jgi:hypothetical protein